MNSIHIARNVFREAIRDRILYAITIFGILMIGFSMFLDTISLEQGPRMIVDVGLTSIMFCSVVITVFLGSSMLFREIEHGTVCLMLSKPISRTSFLIGKWIGLSATVIIVYALMHLVLVVVMLTQHVTVPVSFGANLVMLGLEVSIIGALTVLFSAFTSPLIATVATIILVIVGHLMEHIRGILLVLTASPAIKTVASGLSRTIPNLDVFNIQDQIVYNMQIPFLQIFHSVLYGGAYVVIFMTLACWIFERKEL